MSGQIQTYRGFQLRSHKRSALHQCGDNSAQWPLPFYKLRTGVSHSTLAVAQPIRTPVQAAGTSMKNQTW